MRCPHCGYQMDPHEVRCARCRKYLPAAARPSESSVPVAAGGSATGPRCPHCGYLMEAEEVKCARCRKLVPAAAVVTPGRSWRTEGVLMPGAAQTPMSRLRADSPVTEVPVSVPLPTRLGTPEKPWIMGQVIGVLTLMTGIVMLVLCASNPDEAGTAVWLASLAETGYGAYILAARPSSVSYNALTILVPLGAVAYVFAQLGGS